VDERQERAAGGVLAGGDRVAVHAGGRVRERTALGAGEKEGGRGAGDCRGDEGGGDEGESALAVDVRRGRGGGARFIDR